jgi:LPXTG-motif cell wall-anchored protein
MKVAFADSTSTADAATQTDVTSRLGAADGFTFAVDSPKAGQITIDLSPLFTSEIVKKSNAFVGKKLKINYSLQVAPATDSAHAAADAVDLTKLSNSFVINDQGHTVPGGFFDPPSITVDGTTGFRKVDENGNPLNGAVFTLATYSGIVSGTAISGDANGDGTVSETEASDPVTAGTVTFHHVVLAMSKPYAITETAQPQGYMAMDAVVELTFKRPGLSAPSVSVTLSGPTTGLEDPTDGSEASGDMSEALRSSLSSSGEEGVTGGNTGDATAPVTSASPSAFVFAYGEKQGTDSLDMVTVADDFQSVTVRNVRSLTQLPLTGAFGTVVFSIVGALLAGGAFAMALIAKRNHVASRVA